VKYPVRTSKVDGFRTSAEAIDLASTLHHVDSLYILTYDARKIKHKMYVVSLKNNVTKIKSLNQDFIQFKVLYIECPLFYRSSVLV
jgi:hypothetical protein